MNTEPLPWLAEKQQRLQEQLVGYWAEDLWELGGQNGGKSYLRFTLLSPSLKVELKYALWYKFTSGVQDAKKQQGNLCSNFTHVVKWLNQVASTTTSLLEKTLDYWERSLRSYLVEMGLFKQRRHKHLNASQEYVEAVEEDLRICLLRQCYKIIADAYDDREETEKDCWDMRKLGLPVNLTATNFLLNFAPISQLWLRELAKQFMKYNMAVRSPSDCYAKLEAIRDFSRFLTWHASECSAATIDRVLMVKYISYLRGRKLSVRRQNNLIMHLRIFLQTCSHYLHVTELTREQIIFDEDFAQEPELLSREIPEEVLEQLRKHLHTLPTTTLRMVTILLECGLRINELCSLPLDCLICDDKHEWYLRFYQRKLHKEHIIPLVDDKVIGTIQAQQQEIRTKWEEASPYLFPSPQSHLLPYKQAQFCRHLNTWAVKYEIKDCMERLYHFTAHQFRHTMSMRLLDEDVPLEVISRLLGHRSLIMTQVYARVKEKKLRAELERAAHKRKTVDAQGKEVKGDPRANDPEAQMTRKGMRGQTLPVGGCGRLVVLGECSHANKCLTCPMWLTSTDDLFALKSFYERAVRLKQRAIEKGNQFVIEQQERIIAHLSIRIKSLEETSDGTPSMEEALVQLRMDLAEAESVLEEVRENGLIPATKYLKRAINDLKVRITALEESA